MAKPVIAKLPKWAIVVEVCATNQAGISQVLVCKPFSGSTRQHASDAAWAYRESSQCRVEVEAALKLHNIRAGQVPCFYNYVVKRAQDEKVLGSYAYLFEVK